MMMTKRMMTMTMTMMKAMRILNLMMIVKIKGTPKMSLGPMALAEVKKMTMMMMAMVTMMTLTTTMMMVEKKMRRRMRKKGYLSLLQRRGNKNVNFASFFLIVFICNLLC